MRVAFQFISPGHTPIDMLDAGVLCRGGLGTVPTLARVTRLPWLHRADALHHSR